MLITLVACEGRDRRTPGSPQQCVTFHPTHCRGGEGWNAPPERIPRGLLESRLKKSAVAEHAWKDHHAIKWNEITVVDMTRHSGSCCSRKHPHPDDPS